MRRVLLGTTTLGLALGAGTSAFAQDVLETVIVTAEKTATDIQKTSVSITAIQPDSQRGSGEVMLDDLLKNVATIDIHKGGGSANRAYFIRGLGSSTGSASVPVLYDGVADTTNLGHVGASFDTARIEVLRGPQGTLYGKGAFAGAVNIITNDPTDKYEGKVRVEGGSYNEVAMDALVNIPLNDDMALRVAASSFQRTGFAHPDGRGNDDYAAIRAKFLYHPTEDFSFKLLGSFTNSMGSGTVDTLPMTVKLANFASPAFGGFNPCGGDPHPNKFDPWHSPPKYYGAYSCTVPPQLPVNPNPVTGVCQSVGRAENEAWHIGTDIEYDLGFSNLTILADTSWFGGSLGAHAAQPFLGAVPAQIRWTSATPAKLVEARLASAPDSPFGWVTGIYWENNKSASHNWQRSQNITVTQPLGLDRPNYITDITRAAFGQVKIPIVEGFRINGGLRYSEETLATQALQLNVKTHTLISSPTNTKFKYDQLSYKASIEVDLAENNMMYAQIATGFRPGNTSQNFFCVGQTSHLRYQPGDASNVVLPQPNGGCATTAPATASAVGGTPGETTTSTSVTSSITPDSLKAYEVGSKNRFLDNKVEINAAGYYYSFTHLSGSKRSIAANNTLTPTIQELTGTKAYGAELETSWLITSNDRLDVAIAYSHTEAGENAFLEPRCNNYGTAAHTTIAFVVNGVVNTTLIAACSAKNLAANPSTVNWVRYQDAVKTTDPLFHAPVWNGNISYQHVFDLDSGATVTARAGVHFESSSQQAPNQFLDGVQEAFHQTDASLTYDTSDGKWTMSAWVKNIENKAVIIDAESSGNGLEYVYPIFDQPRTWGVNLTARF